MVALVALVAWGPGAFALDPARDVTQYAHTSWKVRDGFVKGGIPAIAQTPDGYLWLGTEFGLVRFDGVRAVAWEPPPGQQQLPGSLVRCLVVARDGRLWIGTNKGLASWKDGRLILYHDLAGSEIIALLEDHEGTIWVSARLARAPGAICSIRGTVTLCDGGDNTFKYLALHEDRQGNLWLGGTTGLWRWRPDRRFYPMPDVVSSMVDDRNGALLITTRNGMRRLVDERIEPYLPAAGGELTRVLRDSDGGLWIGTTNRGLLHVHQGRIDAIAESDGLSGSYIYDIIEDRERNVWVATTEGLERFRDMSVTTISARQGLSNSTVGSVLTATDGSVWIGTIRGLNRWKDGQVTTYSKHGPRSPASRREIKDASLPDDVISSLYEDRRGRVWVGTREGLVYFESDRFVRVPDVPVDKWVWSMTGDGSDGVWISVESGLLRWRTDTGTQRIAWNQLGHDSPASALAQDSTEGGLWLGFRDGGLAYWKDGQVLRSFKAADGLGEGLVESLRAGADGALWAATGGGLSRLKGDRIATLTSRNGLPCDTVHASIEDDDHAIWLDTACGLVRISASELDGWVADASRKVRVTVLDNSDGVRSQTVTSQFNPRLAKSADGRLWFVTFDGASTVDPRHLVANSAPPPVIVEQIVADRHNYPTSSRLQLPPLIRDLEIQYAATSLVVPAKVQFKYKLEGRDREWQDAGNRRRAFYTDLPPGDYRFRVSAANNSGVWNEQGATLDFSIEPAYWQTNWFRVLVVTALLALAYAIYRLRVAQIARHFNETLDARVAERTRIARELHDTLLQSFHGLLLRFQTARALLPANATKAAEVLDGAIDQAAEAVTEGRDAVQDLRTSASEMNDLADAIRALGEQLGSDNGAGATLRVEVQGASRALHPMVRDEVFRIAGEALRNAFRHSGAKQLEVELSYDDRQMRLRVRDDGKGIDAKLLDEGGREGHFGLRGMRERAKLIGGKLTIWTGLDAGTEVELVVPASHAYVSRSSARSGIVRKLFGRSATRDS